MSAQGTPTASGQADVNATNGCMTRRAEFVAQVRDVIRPPFGTKNPVTDPDAQAEAIACLADGYAAHVAELVCRTPASQRPPARKAAS